MTIKYGFGYTTNAGVAAPALYPLTTISMELAMTYQELTVKFGHIMAVDILMTIEKMAKVTVDDKRLAMSEEKRLASALEALDEVCPVGKKKTG